MTIMNQIYQNQLQKEVTINENFVSLSPFAVFANRGNQSGLTFNYYGGKFQKADGSSKTSFTDGSLILANNSTNYIFWNPTIEAIESNTTGAVNGQTEIAIVTTLNGVITNIEDDRVPALYAKGTRGDLVLDIATASETVKGGFKVGAGLLMTGEVLSVVGGSGGGSSVIIEDEGTEKTAAVTKINFTGAGVTVTNTGDEVTVNIPSSGGGGSGGSTNGLKRNIVTTSRRNGVNNNYSGYSIISQVSGCSIINPSLNNYIEFNIQSNDSIVLIDGIKILKTNIEQYTVIDSVDLTIGGLSVINLTNPSVGSPFTTRTDDSTFQIDSEHDYYIVISFNASNSSGLNVGNFDNESNIKSQYIYGNQLSITTVPTEGYTNRFLISRFIANDI